MFKIIILSIILSILVLGCIPKMGNKEWCVGCGERFLYWDILLSELRCNEYGVQFCTSCAKEYPNLFKNILTVEDGNDCDCNNTE